MTTMPAIARWTLFAAMALGAANPAAAADEKLLAAARAAQPAMIESLREMVLMESGSQDAAGLKSMAD
jgi:glutamate carboxypeptidase